ncbi:hypothetical protein [Paenibacillus sp. tmac-D7]|uniref:hypothetical protein n=1 Tax=Paenibacillus sp. tmac-D7 TaxID=2591462 RepID=UPI001143DB12|nr:hypothetical protein [Paenibacillus sp. tmac-D7]
MAETYRKSKVEHYVSRLLLRKNALKRQVEQAEFVEMKDFFRGQLAAIDLIIDELTAEFALEESHRKIEGESCS